VAVGSQVVEDLIGRLVPDKRFWVVVPAPRPGADGDLELFGGAVRPSPEPFVSELGEPALH